VRFKVNMECHSKGFHNVVSLNYLPFIEIHFKISVQRVAFSPSEWVATLDRNWWQESGGGVLSDKVLPSAPCLKQPNPVIDESSSI
jgi:hypothetical protein